MRRRLLLLSVFGVLALALAPLTQANNGNKPVREFNPDQGEGIVEGGCAFPVFVHIEGPEIVTHFSTRDRSVLKVIAITPGNTWTLTNVENGKSVTVDNTSSYHEEDYPDGTFAVKVVGEGVWFGNPLTLEPGFWYQKGQISGVFNPDGTPISTKGTGSFVNLCPRLAD